MACAHGDDEIGEEGIFGFAAAMGDDGGVICFAGHFDGFDGFADGADLVELDQNGVADAFGDAARENFRVGDEDIVADELNFFAQGSRVMSLPAVPIVFGEAIFDRDDRVLAHPAFPEFHHLLGGARGFVGFLEDVFFGGAVVELAGRRVEGDGDLFAGLVAGGGDGFEDAFERFFVGFQVGREAAFIADGGGIAVFLSTDFR